MSVSYIDDSTALREEISELREQLAKVEETLRERSFFAEDDLIVIKDALSFYISYEPGWPSGDATALPRLMARVEAALDTASKVKG